MPRNPKVEFDMLQMYFGEPYTIDLEDVPGKIVVYSPTIGDIIEMGEKKFYQTLNIFICNTTQYRVILWDLGIDWNEFSDFELFIMLSQQIDPDVSKLLFGDLNFGKFKPLLLTKQPTEENPEPKPVPILWDEEDEIEINYDVYNHFSQYIRTMFNTFPEEKITQDQTLKSWYIIKDRRALENQTKKIKNKKKDNEESSSIQSLISSCINHPGFKYSLKELKNVGVAEFYDSVKRLQVYEQSTALMKGMYSGFVDGSKLKSSDYNFMREI